MHIVSGYIEGFAFFCFEGDGASQAIQRERGPRRHSRWKEGSAASRRENSQTLRHSEGTQVGKETYLNSHSFSQLLKNVSPRAS